MTERVNINFPVGRFVSGSLTEMKDRDHQNRPIEPEKRRFEFGLAIEKTHPDLPRVFGEIAAAAKAGYANQPHVQGRIDQWFQTMSGFSMKISDGDKPAASTGRVNEHTAGHFVFWFSTAMPINCCNAQNIQIDPATIKRGWYVDVAGSVAANGLVDNNAGIYMNPSWVRLIGEGEEIVGGISADQAFGDAPAAPAHVPAGMRPVGSTPSAPASSGAPGGGLPGAAPAPAPAAPAPAPAANPTPAAAPAPTAYAPTAAAPAPAPAAPTTAYPPAPDAVGVTPGAAAPAAQPAAGLPGLPGSTQTR